MKVALVLFISFFTLNLFAQDFYLIGGADPSGDCTTICSDIRELRYDYDVALDSAWFRIITYEDRSNDDGYYIHINWEDDDTDGDDWTGGTFYLDFKQNRQINIMYGTAYYWIEEFDAGSGTYVTDEVSVSFPNNLTTIINCKLSDIDPDMDGTFEVAASVGNSAYGIFDLLPDSGNESTDPPVGVEEEKEEELTIYPNPTTGTVSINFGDELVDRLTILNTVGKEVYSSNTKNLHSLKLDLSDLPAGVYFVELSSGEGTLTKRLIVR